jgi:hypothetical protein
VVLVESTALGSELGVDFPCMVSGMDGVGNPRESLNTVQLENDNRSLLDRRHRRNGSPRGRRRGNQMPIMALAVAAEQPSPQSLGRLYHAYARFQGRGQYTYRQR